MIIKYEFAGDKAVVFIPDNVQWEIVNRCFNDKGFDDNGLYLVVDGQERTLEAGDAWSGGDKKIPDFEVSCLHEEVIDVIAERMANHPDLRIIDINEIIDGLISSKYYKRWLEKEYIKPDAKGCW